MKFRQLEYSRTFNLGDYQSERISLISDLDLDEDLDEAFKAMKGRVFKLHEEGQLLEETKEVVEANKEREASTWDPSKISWQQTEGARGLYERYPALGQRAEATLDYVNMVKDLKDHDDRLTRGNYFFWLFSDGATVGRKQKRK